MSSNYFPSDPRHFVRDELELRQSRRPQYSLRAFARDLEISASYLCEFLNGRQGLSKARVFEIGEKLRLSPDQRDHFWDLIESRYGRTLAAKRAALHRAKDRLRDPENQLSREKFLAIADWYHFALLELLTVNPMFTASKMAETLAVSPDEVSVALARLEKLGLITQRSDKNGFDVLEDESTVGGMGSDSAIQMAHEHTLKKHLEFCREKDYANRENVSMTFSINKEQWPELRRDLQKAVLKVVSAHGHSVLNKDQVISLTLQMVTLL